MHQYFCRIYSRKGYLFICKFKSSLLCAVNLLWDFESRKVPRFYTEWRKAIRRLFNLTRRAHSRYLHLICNDPPINVQLYKRFNKFIHRILNSDNDYVKLAGKLAVYGSQSNVSKNINVIAQELNRSQALVLETPSKFKSISDNYEHSKLMLMMRK